MRCRLAALAWLLPAACGAAAAPPPLHLPLHLHLLSVEAPPYVQAGPDGRAGGAAADLVAELCARVHVQPQVRLYPLARAMALMRHGDADGMFMVTKTPERAARYAFSAQPLLRQELVLFVRRDSALHYDGKLASLSGHTLGLVRGASHGQAFDTALAHGTLGGIDYSASAEASFRKLLAGRVDMVVSDQASGWATLHRLGAAQRVRLAGVPLQASTGYLMFNRRRVAPRLLRRIDEAMAGMRHDGSAQRIRSHYGLR